MKQLKSRYLDLRESFMNIQAKHIYEVFEAYLGNTDSIILKKIMSEKDFDVMGVRENDIICGYVNQSELKNGPCSNYLKTFHISELISESTPITSLVSLLKKNLGCL